MRSPALKSIVPVLSCAALECESVNGCATVMVPALWISASMVRGPPVPGKIEIVLPDGLVSVPLVTVSCDEYVYRLLVSSIKPLFVNPLATVSVENPVPPVG